MSRRLSLVGAPDPTDIFNDLNLLRQEQRGPSGRRRTRATELFARVPCDRALALRPRLSGSAWLVLFELDRAVLKGRRNPVRLPGARLKAAGITRHSRQWALRRLEAAGVIRIEQRGKGCNPLVRHLWYPQQN